MDVVEESHTLAFLQRYASELVNDLEKRAPPFFVTAAKVREGRGQGAGGVRFFLCVTLLGSPMAKQQGVGLMRHGY